jgi:hypothetical protein
MSSVRRLRPQRRGGRDWTSCCRLGIVMRIEEKRVYGQSELIAFCWILRLRGDLTWLLFTLYRRPSRYTFNLIATVLFRPVQPHDRQCQSAHRGRLWTESPSHLDRLNFYGQAFLATLRVFTNTQSSHSRRAKCIPQVLPLQARHSWLVRVSHGAVSPAMLPGYMKSNIRTSLSCSTA